MPKERSEFIRCEIGGEQCAVQVVYSKRKTIALKVTSAGRLILSVPLRTSASQLIQVVESKSKWINKARIQVASRQVLSVERFVKENKEIPIRGKLYTLEVLPSEIEACYFQAQKLIVKLKDPTDENIVSLIEGRLKKEAEEVLIAKTNHFALVLIESPSKIIIKSQKKRWGTCSSSREIRLNWKCIFLEDSLMDYIVLHEICHLKQMNHSSLFWHELSAILPDYQTKRQALKNYILWEETQ